MISERFEIVEIGKRQAMGIVAEVHYLHRKCPCSHAYALAERDTHRVVGVVTYGVPCSSTLLKGICGEAEARNVYELNRLWVDDSVPRNAESFLVSHTLKMLDREIVVSFADSSMGHIGYVYQASNFLYCGLSAKFRDPKVRGLEHMHHATYAHGMTMEQVKEKYGAENVYYAERPRKHRYVYFNAPKMRRKQLMRELRYPVLPYPKRNGAAPRTATDSEHPFYLDGQLRMEV